MKSVTYDGTFAAVEIPELGITAKRGEPQEVSNEKAEKLEKLAGWTISDPPKENDEKGDDN